MTPTSSTDVAAWFRARCGSIFHPPRPLRPTEFPIAAEPGIPVPFAFRSPSWLAPTIPAIRDESWAGQLVVIWDAGAFKERSLLWRVSPDRTLHAWARLPEGWTLTEARPGAMHHTAWGCFAFHQGSWWLANTR